MDHGSLRIFMSGDVARILDISIVQIKNWLLGRPLKIKLQHHAHGSGSRNLFGIDDIRRFKVAQQLYADGFAPRAIQLIVDELYVDLEDVGVVIITSRNQEADKKKEGQLQIQTYTTAQFKQAGSGTITNLLHQALGCYVLNVAGIVQRVDGLVRAYCNEPSSTQARVTSDEPNGVVKMNWRHSTCSSSCFNAS